MSDWVRVEERLPKLFKGMPRKVLITYRRIIERHTDSVYWNGETWCDWDANTNTYKPLHPDVQVYAWMPFPEPYDEES